VLLFGIKAAAGVLETISNNVALTTALVATLIVLKVVVEIHI